MVISPVPALMYFMPIFSFLLVFIVLYSILVKSGILGENKLVMLFVSFILASFFIVDANLVKFVEFSSAWFALGISALFFLFIILAFLPGDKPLHFLVEGNWFSWAVLSVAIGFFIVASAYIFNWAINWKILNDIFGNEWFGMVLLLIIAGVVSWKITK